TSELDSGTVAACGPSVVETGGVVEDADPHATATSSARSAAPATRITGVERLRLIGLPATLCCDATSRQFVPRRGTQRRKVGDRYDHQRRSQLAVSAIR